MHVEQTDMPAGGPMPEYPAAVSFVLLLRQLLFGRGRGDWPMPLVPLRTHDDAASATAWISPLFAADGRQVPHVTVPDVPTVRALLHEVYGGLSQDFGLPVVKLRHYRLAHWLVGLDLREVGVDEQQRLLYRRLREYLHLQTGDRAAPAQALGGWIGFSYWLAATILPGPLMRMLVTGRLLGFGREFRWAVRQQYPSPRPTGGFFAFARHLGRHGHEPAMQPKLDRLLVHALLQDFRVAYRRRPWRLAAWRRTAAPVVLLEDASAGTAGAALLELINAVRHDTEETDPLLVVAGRVRVPATAPTGMPLGGVAGAYEAWRARLRADSRAGANTRWYLLMARPHPGLVDLVDDLPKIRPPRPPVLAHPLAVCALLLLALLGTGGWYSPELYAAWQARAAGCLTLVTDGTIRTKLIGGECVGYSDHPDQYFTGDSGLRDAENIIFANNRLAREAAEKRPDQPHVTFVYLGSLTKPGTLATEETFAAEREELQGMAAAQSRAYALATNDPAQPLLRILVANAGQEMGHAGEVVPMLGDLARRDPSVAGVVGLVESRTGTKDAIRKLSDAHLPTIAPTLSADDIADGARQYLQLSAPNIDEARLVHDHATKVLGKKRVMNFYTYGSKGEQAAASDLYVQTLAAGVRAKFGVANYAGAFWTPRVGLRPYCKDRFPDGVVFFGGRYSEFGAFADALAATCNGQAALIADDSVNRYMANARLRERAPANLPVAYVSKGALAYCDRLADAGDTERTGFLEDVRAVLQACTPGRPVGERVGLAYDATRLLLKAVTVLTADDGWRAEPGFSAQVYAQARALSTPYRSTTGLTRFDARGVATGKRLTLLCARNIQQAFRTDADVPHEIDQGWRSPVQQAEEQTYYDERPLKPRPCR